MNWRGPSVLSKRTESAQSERALQTVAGFFSYTCKHRATPGAGMRCSGRRQLIGALEAVAIVSGLTYAGAQTSTGPPVDASAQTGAVAASTQRGRSDTMLASDVRRALVRAPGLNSMNIHVRVRGGIATLTGSVPQHSQIARAGHAARSVRGVRAVTNRLTLRTGPGGGR